MHTVVALGSAPAHGIPVRAADELTLITDRGIEGDRYAGTTRQVTLVSLGELSEAAAKQGLDSIDALLTRRNIVVDAPTLPRKHGTRITIGDVVLSVWRDCPPCELMDKTFGDGTQQSMRNLAGISAKVVSGGVITVGDPVEL